MPRKKQPKPNIDQEHTEITSQLHQADSLPDSTPAEPKQPSKTTPIIEQPDASDPLAHTPSPRDETAIETQDRSFTEREQERRQHGEPKNGVTREQSQPNPFGEATLSLTNDNDGPKMRLYRDRRNPQAGIYDNATVIQFDEKPDDEVRSKLRDNGWSWKQADAVWKKPLGDFPATRHQDAQKLFEEIADGIRASNGLEPLSGMGNGRS